MKKQRYLYQIFVVLFILSGVDESFFSRCEALTMIKPRVQPRTGLGTQAFGISADLPETGMVKTVTKEGKASVAVASLLEERIQQAKTLTNNRLNVIDAINKDLSSEEPKDIEEINKEIEESETFSRRIESILPRFESKYDELGDNEPDKTVIRKKINELRESHSRLGSEIKHAREVLAKREEFAQQEQGKKEQIGEDQGTPEESRQETLAAEGLREPEEVGSEPEVSKIPSLPIEKKPQEDLLEEKGKRSQQLPDEERAARLQALRSLREKKEQREKEERERAQEQEDLARQQFEEYLKLSQQIRLAEEGQEFAETVQQPFSPNNLIELRDLLATLQTTL